MLCYASLRFELAGRNSVEKIHKYQSREEDAIAIRQCGSSSRPVAPCFKLRFKIYFYILHGTIRLLPSLEAFLVFVMLQY